jgi:predicted amidohydrolase
LRGNRERCTEIARELSVPVVATNRCGFSYHYFQTGGSFMIADDGEVVALANTDGEEEVIYAEWSALTPRRSARAEATAAAR